MQMQTIAVQSDRLQKTTRLDGVIIILLFSLGLYFPSSIVTHISKVLLGIFDTEQSRYVRCWLSFI